jgi:uncharacterized protein (TIGR02246 family)
MAVGAVLLAACRAPATADPQAEINAMLTHSATAWNRGDLQGFMSDYLNDSTVSFMSRGHVQYGWQPVFDNYQRNYFAPGKSRDSLTFEELHVRSLGTDAAFATARFKLTRGDSTVASGPFTLVLRKVSDRWLIIHDHTSSDPQ